MQSLDLLTAAQVAERKGVAVSTVAKWARSGKLRTAWQAHGKTGARYFDPSDVDAIVVDDEQAVA